MTREVQDLVLDEEAEQLAKALSVATGESIEEAIKIALRERLVTVNKLRLLEEEYIARVDAIIEPFSELPILDHRSEDEILGYNEHGYFD